ncbi:MAG: NAD-dependent epimerase/dehydratase family protein [Thermoplasmata archaeon]
MSAAYAVRSAASIVLLIIGVLLLVFAAVDFLTGFGLLYCLVLLVLGIVFLALSGRVYEPRERTSTPTLSLILKGLLRRTMASETVLVTGATGLVGSQVVRELSQNGHVVRAVVRRPESVSSLQGDRIEPVLGDLAVKGDWTASLSDITAVVEATQVRVPGRLTLSKARAAAKERQKMTGLLLNSLRSRSVALRAYISLSGLEDYAAHGDSWFDESSPIATTPHGFAHIGLAARPVLQAARSEWNLPLVTLRMGLIYGNGGWFPSFVERARAGRGAIIGPGTNYNSLVSAADVAQAIRLAVEKAPVGKEIIVADDEPVQQSEWLRSLSEIVNQPPPRRHVPPWLASLVAGQINVETFANSKRPRNRQMKELLGVKLSYPRFREGFQATVDSLPAGAKR